MLAHIISPESCPLNKNLKRPYGFHPTKGYHTQRGYSLSTGEKAKWDRNNYTQLTPVTDEVTERVKNIISPNQAAAYLRGLVGYNQQNIKRIIRRRKSHI